MLNDFLLYVYMTFILYTIFYSQHNVHVNMFDFYIIHFPCNYIIFAENQNQLVAQYSSLLVVRSTCFAQIYWPHMRRCFKLELSHVVTNVLVFKNINLLTSVCR